MSGRIASAAISSLASAGIVCCVLAVQPSIRAQQAPEPPLDHASRSVWDGVYTADQAKRGEALYVQECAMCHGATLKDGELATPLAGEAFRQEWNGHSAGDLFERMRTTMPEGAPGKLSGQEYADVLAHVLSVNEFPAGTSELESSTELLKQIRIEAMKPADKSP